jgi:hypothetical protein
MAVHASAHRALDEAGQIDIVRTVRRVADHAVLGRVADMLQALEAYFASHAPGSRRAGLLLRQTAFELRAHGHAEAARIATWLATLERPYLLGEHTYWRARIAALLDQREHAVARFPLIGVLLRGHRDS